MVLSIVIAVGLGASHAPATLRLEDVLRDVAEHAPQIAAQRASVDVASARVGVEGAWADPVLSGMVESVPFRGGEDAPVPMFTWRFSQELNVFGRRGLAKDAARAQVAQANAQLGRVSYDAQAQAVVAFYELWMNREMRALIDRQLTVLEQMRQSATARYAAGMMGHHDVLRSDAEIASMRAEKSALESEEQAMVAMLNVLRGHPHDEPIAAIEKPKRATIPDVCALIARREGRPELQAMRAMVAEMDARRSLAGRMYLPMPMLSAFYEQRPQGMPDSFGGEVMLTVPLWWFDRERNEVAMADAMVRRAERDLGAMDAMTIADLEAAWSRARSSDAALSALESTALPRLRETVESALTDYAAGRGDFLALLESVMALQRIESQRIEAVARREIAVFELTRLIGGAPGGGTP